jgi:phosphoribosyl 1,2-cyclic phosphodiesterase
MAVSITVLASGSRGNCSVVASSETRLLVDIGLSCKETCKRLHASGFDASSLDGILITHEHSDHVSGLYVMAKKFGIPVFMTGATHHAWAKWARDSNGNPVSIEKLEVFDSGRKFSVGDIDVTPFTVPHDAADPVGFTFGAEGIKLGVVTDLGFMPPNVKDWLRGCDGLLIESNHDLEMLRTGPYPWSVKQRVMSRNGHMSNDALADFLATDYDGEAAFLILAHLSEANNHPEVARICAEKALGQRQSLLRNRLVMASQDEPLPTMML